MSQSKFALPRNGFTFKQFFVAHDRCAMKVGTDGILLGAWAPIAPTPPRVAWRPAPAWARVT